jgi:membrane protein
LKFFSFLKQALLIIPNEKRPIRTFFVKWFRVVYFSINSFYKDDCYLKSSLLTFYSLLSLVPFLALVIAIAKGFGFASFLQEEILKTFKEQKDVLTIAIQFAYSLILHLESGFIAGLGVFFLFFSAFGLLETIEISINHIWKIKRKRSFLRKAIDYIGILIIVPIIFTSSSSLTIFINTQLSTKYQNYQIIKDVYPYLLSLIKLVPFVLSWVLFAFIYIITPNTRVRVLPRLFGGFLAGTLFQLWQIAYIIFQVSISSYNAVYGSFAALPLFLIWLQITFVIFLYGAEVAAHIENDIFWYGGWKETDRLTKVTLKQVALLALIQFTSAFEKGKPPLSMFQMGRNLGISINDAREVVNYLEDMEIITEINPRRNSNEKFQLNINPELLTVKKISDLFDKKRDPPFFVKESNSVKLISECFGKFEESINSSSTDVNLKHISELSESE